MQAVLTRFFEARGIRVAGAFSLADARARISREGFDAFLLDVGLPDGDGLTLLEWATPERSVVISANPDVARYERCGVRHHLAKPFDLEALARAVDAVMGAAA